MKTVNITSETTRKRSWVWGAAAVVGATIGAAALGATTSRPGLWYHQLKKPAGTPPNAAFGPVWTLLYMGIAYAGVRLVRAPASPERRKALAWWSTQLALNAAWSPVFFGVKQPAAAMVIIGALVPAIAATTNAARKVDGPSAVLMLPYLAWTSYATYLNAGILLKNHV